MKFTLSTSADCYTKDAAAKLEKLGFKFEESQENDKFIDYLHEPTININTLDELVAFSVEWGKLVFSPNSIEIYDDYRE